MNEVLMQDAQNLIEDKILPIVLVTFIARLVSVSVRPTNVRITTTKYFCFFSKCDSGIEKTSLTTHGLNICFSH